MTITPNKPAMSSESASDTSTSTITGRKARAAATAAADRAVSGTPFPWTQIHTSLTVLAPW